ncbi:MAG: hypothetical protein BM556_00635 [Bacteriovorax sp. MedPE-SWde]|nr:MAG: hypothetical protein BM556_00635 [Bacteriovorax sp. MedPE-SWde]
MKVRRYFLLLALVCLSINAESEELQIIENIEFLESMELLEDSNWEVINIDERSLNTENNESKMEFE